MSDDGGGSGSGGSGSERQVPFFCPYCGDESLRPSGPEAGGWSCGSCARSFKLSFAGLVGSGAQR
ncbi:MAG TPA: hypothetical protein VFI65_10360 [Streptosporangiaceae bacterium]|nr:hypothetical protein [Streptosporangiaceae bacterium]